MADWYSISDINKPVNTIIERGYRKCDRYFNDIVVPLNFRLRNEDSLSCHDIGCRIFSILRFILERVVFKVSVPTQYYFSLNLI